jgi:hypothetical protein
MALSSLLEIVNRAQDELGLPRSTAIAASTDPQPRQFYALANAAGRAIMRRHAWGDLRTLGTITTVASTSDYSLPSDFARLVARTLWDRTNKIDITLDTPQIMRFRTETNLSTSPLNRSIQQLGQTSLRVFPTPTASGNTLVYEYVSKKWARSAASVAQEEFQADTDTSVFNADLLVRELKWRFKAAKGFACDAERGEADTLLNQLIAADTGMPTISAAPQDNTAVLVGFGNIPDSGYGS